MGFLFACLAWSVPADKRQSASESQQTRSLISMTCVRIRNCTNHRDDRWRVTPYFEVGCFPLCSRCTDRGDVWDGTQSDGEGSDGVAGAIATLCSAQGLWGRHSVPNGWVQGAAEKKAWHWAESVFLWRKASRQDFRLTCGSGKIA